MNRGEISLKLLASKEVMKDLEKTYKKILEENISIHSIAGIPVISNAFFEPDEWVLVDNRGNIIAGNLRRGTNEPRRD